MVFIVKQLSCIFEIRVIVQKATEQQFHLNFEWGMLRIPVSFRIDIAFRQRLLEFLFLAFNKRNFSSSVAFKALWKLNLRLEIEIGIVVRISRPINNRRNNSLM